jgi:hypothetical protein
MQVGGRPASPKLAGLGFSPLGTTFGVDVLDAFLMAVMVEHQSFLQLQGRPTLTKLVGLVLARLSPPFHHHMYQRVGFAHDGGSEPEDSWSHCM